MHIITGHNLLKRSKKSGDRPNPNLSGKTLQVKRPEKYQKKKHVMVTCLPVSLWNSLASVLQFCLDPNRPCRITKGGSFPPSVVASMLS